MRTHLPRIADGPARSHLSDDRTLLGNAGSADRRGLTELEEAWLVRSLYREDRLPQPEIARRMNRHKSWVWRRLMLVEALDPLVQTDVRLGLIAPGAAVAVSRLPRGNQQAASAVVTRRGLTVRQTEALVDEALSQHDLGARQALLVRRLDGPAIGSPPGPRPARVTRSDTDRLSLDILRMREIAARLEARLLSTPLEVYAKRFIGPVSITARPASRDWNDRSARMRSPSRSDLIEPFAQRRRGARSPRLAALVVR